ncbi:MAG: SdpI family protein [Fimbriimonas sp.]
MNIRRSLAWQAAFLGTSIVASLLAASKMPTRVPTHWGIDGKPDAWGSPSFSLWFGPIGITLVIALTVGVPWLPRGRNVARFGPTYGKLMAIIGGFFLFNHVVILYATLDAKSLPSIFLVGLFLFFAILGNFMGKIRQNPYMGIRTPWTLKSERVWEATHRRGAWIFVVGGLVGAALALAGLPMGVTLGWMMVVVFAPVVDSYFQYRRLEGR